MSLDVVGFNVFNQWCTEDLILKKFTKINLLELNTDNNFEVLYIGWSYNLLRNNKKLYLSGFNTGNVKQVREIQLPNEISCADNVLVTGTDHYILMLDKISLTLWKSSFGDDSFCDWLKVPPFWSVETSVQTSTESLKLNIVSLKSSCTMNLCLSIEGHVYDIPQKINISHCIGKIEQLDCGYEHAIIVTDVGNVYTWGNGRRCQLGHGDLRNVEEPQLVEALAGVKIVCVRAGGWHSCAISEGGDLYTWGWNQAGQLGLGRPQEHVPGPATKPKSPKYNEETVTSVAFPTLVDLYEPDVNCPLECEIVDVACGSKHTAIILRDKSIWMTGSNAYCQLGIDFDKVPYSKHFQKVRQDNMNCSLLCGPWSTVIRYEV